MDYDAAGNLYISSFTGGSIFRIAPDRSVTKIASGFTTPADISVDNVSVEDLEEAVTYPVDAFLSRDYAEAEKDKLWAKVWQMAGRLEEIPEVGDFITYEIGDDSIIVVRSAPDTIKAYHNVCAHRGRRLIDTLDGHRALLVLRRKGPHCLP